MPRYLYIIVSLLLMSAVPVSACGYAARPDSVGATSGVADSVPQATAASSDTPRMARRGFPTRSVVFSGALAAAGAMGLWSPWLKDLNADITDGITRHIGSRPLTCDNWMQYTPVAAYMALGWVPGVRVPHSTTDRLLCAATAFGIMAVVSNGTKFMVDEQRPDKSDFKSFPSGHTATVFMGAELLRLEYGNCVGAAGYAVSATVAFLRIYNHRHWFTDVVSGAGIGIMSANLAYWLLPYEKKLLRLTDRDMSVSLMPMYTPAERSLSLALGINF